MRSRLPDAQPGPDRSSATAVPAIPDVPAAPVAAYIVGFVLYFVFYKAGLKSSLLAMPQRIDVA